MPRGNLMFVRQIFAQEAIKGKYTSFTTVFVDTRLWKTKHTRKRFQNFRQPCVLDRIEIHQLQPLVWPSNLLCVMLSGCDWWISIRSVNNTQDWRKFWKCFRVCFFPKSRINENGGKTSIFFLEASLLGQIFVSRTSNFRGGNYQPTVLRQKHSAV